MKVSRSKTEYLCINGGNNDETVNMEDTKVLRVKKFKYLGSTMQESGSCVLGKDTLRHFPLVGGLGKQF